MQRISRSQLSKKYSIPNSQWQRRHDDLLDWINDFFSIVEIKDDKSGYYYYEVPDELPNEIPKLPRKNNQQERIEKYENYVQEKLPDDFKLLSKAKMSRDAIRDFGAKDFGHKNEETVSKRYVGPAMEKYGEHTDAYFWGNCETYEQLTAEQEAYWRQCLSNNNITDDVVKELGWQVLVEGVLKSNKQIETMQERFDNARIQFSLHYGFFVVRAPGWRKKREISDKFEQLN